MSDTTPITIDKTNTRVTLGLAGLAAVAFWYASAEWSDVKDLVGDNGTAIQEVKVQLDDMAGAEKLQDDEIRKMQQAHRDHERRLKVLETK